MPGLGHEPLGHYPEGHVDWARIVLWDELPEKERQKDFDAGGWYYKFVTALMPSFTELVQLIYGAKKNIIDPTTVRPDLLRYVANKFGVILDFAEPEAYQRTRVEIAGRWRLIKGSKTSYEVLCAVHGFDVVVNEIWWNGSDYTTLGPLVTNEIIGYIP